MGRKLLKKIGQRSAGPDPGSLKSAEKYGDAFNGKNRHDAIQFGGFQTIAASMPPQARMRKLIRSPVITEATMEIRAMIAAQLAVRPLLEVAIATTTTNAGKHALAR